MRSTRNVCQNIHAHIIQQVSINPSLITNPEVSASDTTVSDYGQSSGSKGGLNLQIPSPQSPLLESGIPLEPVATLRLQSQGRHQLRRGRGIHRREGHRAQLSALDQFHPCRPSHGPLQESGYAPDLFFANSQTREISTFDRPVRISKVWSKCSAKRSILLLGSRPN